jgi:hypothetical protein
LLIAQGSSVAEARQAIQLQYDRWSKAYMANDAESLVAILAPGYTLKNFLKETTSYETYCAYLRAKAKSGVATPYKTDTRIRKLSLKGEVADVIAIETMLQDVVDPKTQRPAISVHRHEYRDVWRKMEGAWRLSSTTTLKESTQIKPAN